MNFEFFFTGFKKKIIFYTSVILIIVCGFLAFFGFFVKTDNTIFDLLLRVSSEPKASSEIVFLDIDDESLDKVGSWPWTRDILADVVITMKELGASDITFDIEYLSPSQHGIDPDTIENIPGLVADSEKTITDIMNELANAVATGNIQPEYVVEVNDNIVNDNILPTFNELNNAINYISRDNDDYFGRALQFFGNSWLTVNYMDVIKTNEEDINYVKARFLLDNVQDSGNYIYKTNRHTFSLQPEATEGFSPAQNILVQRAAGVGFTNVLVDSDGIRRRIELLYQKDGKYLPQLIFAPLLNRIDVQSIERHKNYIILKDALVSKDSPRKNISIPLDRNGYMLINWQHKTYDESFKHIPIISVLNLSDTEERIIACLEWLYNECYLLSSDGSWLSYYTEAEKLLKDYQKIKDYKKYLLSKCNGYYKDGSPISEVITNEEYDEYFDSRRFFFIDCINYATGNHLTQIETRLEELLQEGYSSEDIEAFYTSVAEVFDALKGNVDVYQEDFAYFSNQARNAFCVVGNKATGNTDMGTTPFASRYPNVGTHANLYNTIIQQDFVYPLKWEISFIFAAIFLLIYSWFSKTGKNRFRNLIGVFAIISLPIISIILMYTGTIFLPITAAFVVVFLGYIIDMIYRFLNAEQDKKFLKQAFSTYLSEDVVDDIVANPEKLALGGTEKQMTALFSDIKGFSSISEKTTPQQLVSVLNEYLTIMSNLILEEKGTIDKYIGDAIVSFFGAPTDLEDHAFRACAAAIRMKQMEDKINIKMLREGILVEPIFTRIGINTGKMVVGNMGTDKKMNYTIMGNNVNIASRLEGVNKVYNSWIIISETTWEEANVGNNLGVLTARRLDKVRVMGIEQPVQLYNLVGFTSELSKQELDSLVEYHKGMDLYLSKKFNEALDHFQLAKKLNPADTVATVFIERCKKYIKDPPAASWNGIMTMMTK